MSRRAGPPPAPPLPPRPPLASAPVDPGAPAVPWSLSRVTRTHPVVTDVLVAGTALVFDAGLAQFVSSGETNEVRVWEAIVWIASAVIAATALLWRRRAPAVVLAAILATTVVSTVLDGQVSILSMWFALYALGVYASVRAAFVGLGASAAVVLLSAQLAMMAAGAGDAAGMTSSLITATQFSVFALIATLVGTSVGNRRRYVAALVDRAERLERERDQQARLAVAAERARITRDVHDVVSHSLSVIVALPDGAAAVAEKDPEGARRAVREVGEVGRGSLAEMSRLLGVLRAPGGASLEADAPLQPQPSIAELPELVARAGAAGLPVRLVTEGTPPSDLGLQAAVYRVAQEALTNTLRHSVDPGEVLVSISSGSGTTSVTVTDDGGSRADPRESAGSGGGLIGMRERAAMFDGTVQAGPRVGRGWRVHATFLETTTETRAR